MELSELLLNEAVKQGLCQAWQQAWKGDMGSLMSMYKRGIDFCIEHDYPSLDIIRRYLKGKTEEYNIFVDTQDEVTLYSDTAVALGDSKLRIWVADYGVLNLYLRHESEVDIFCGPNSIVSVETYENSVLRVHNARKVSVYQYDNSKMYGEGVKLYKRERDAT
jgi:hypothetical protein